MKGACESKPGETEILMGYVVYDDENCDGNNDTLASDLKNMIDINQVKNLYSNNDQNGPDQSKSHFSLFRILQPLMQFFNHLWL